MRGTAGLGFSSQEQVDVQEGFSPSCCSTTPIHSTFSLTQQYEFKLFIIISHRIHKIPLSSDSFHITPITLYDCSGSKIFT